MAFTTGQQLHGGRYTVENKLKEGRFATTYLAKDRQGSLVVIKTPSDEALRQRTKEQSAKLQDKFWREAMKLATCQHPHIVRAREPFRERTGWGITRTERVCIPMDYIDGKDLEKHPPMVVDEALAYIQQIGEALIEVHRKGLLHLDVKPANIVVKKGSKEAVLIDFGLAREFDQPLTTLNPTTVDGFAPPELYDPNAKWGYYTDIYSLAATLYALLTGEVPPKSVDRPRYHLITPQEKSPQISDRVNNAIIWGMELESNRRPQTIRQWLDDLLGVKSATPEPEPPPNLAHPRPIEIEMRDLAIKGIKITLALGLLGAFISLLSGLPGWIDRMEKSKPSPSVSPSSTSPIN